MTRFLTTSIRAPNLRGPVSETMHAIAMELDWEERMKMIGRTLRENVRMLRKRRHRQRRRRLPIWEGDEAWWWRRRRSSMQDWAPNARALFESMQDEEEEDGEVEEDEDVEEEEDENEEEGMDLSKREMTFVGKDMGTIELVGKLWW